MYLLNWDLENRVIEANLGGVITPGEMDVLTEELLEEFVQQDVSGWDFVLDTTVVRRLEAGVGEAVDRLRNYLTLNGLKLVWVAEDAAMVEALTMQNLQGVLEGREEYRMSA